MPNKPICVYIAGSGRNGSTLLGQLLEQSQDVFFAGELTHIWERSYANNELCGCGVQFSQCEFWEAVTKDAFGEIGPSELKHLKSLRSKISKLTRLPYLLANCLHADSRLVKECRRLGEAKRNPTHCGWRTRKHLRQLRRIAQRRFQIVEMLGYANPREVTL